MMACNIIEGTVKENINAVDVMSEEQQEHLREIRNRAILNEGMGIFTKKLRRYKIAVAILSVTAIVGAMAVSILMNMIWATGVMILGMTLVVGGAIGLGIRAYNKYNYINEIVSRIEDTLDKKKIIEYELEVIIDSEKKSRTVEFK